MQEATRQAVEAIRGVAQIIGEMDRVASTTVEIARNVRQAAAGTHEVSSNIAGVSQAAGSSGTAACAVLAVSKNLFSSL